MKELDTVSRTGRRNSAASASTRRARPLPCLRDRKGRFPSPRIPKLSEARFPARHRGSTAKAVISVTTTVAAQRIGRFMLPNWFWRKCWRK